MRSRLRKTMLLGGALALAAAGTAYGISGNIFGTKISVTATMQPRELPKHGNAPITLSSITRVGTKNGKTPPTLREIDFLIDKHGTIDTKGLPRCTMAKLEGATPSQARQRCAGALVGKGFAKALVTMPGQDPFTISSPVSFFNGPPSGGQPTVIVHAYEKVPAPQALLAQFTIEKVSKGRYGYHVHIEMPEIAGGYGAPTLAEATIGATRMRGGKKVGYINAHCSGGRLQVNGELKFDEYLFPATLTSPCHFPH